MGYNKRYVSRETLVESVDDKESLKRLFSADAFIFLDDFSTKIFKMYRSGTKKKEIVKLIKEHGRKKD